LGLSTQPTPLQNVVLCNFFLHFTIGYFFGLVLLEKPMRVAGCLVLIVAKACRAKPHETSMRAPCIFSAHFQTALCDLLHEFVQCGLILFFIFQIYTACFIHRFTTGVQHVAKIFHHRRLRRLGHRIG
jgi:hypothetical protein